LALPAFLEMFASTGGVPPKVAIALVREINEYLRREVDDLRNSLRQISRAINAEADKRVEGENWSLIGDYVKSCRETLIDIFGVWPKG
jgi:hypothetical protein